MEDWEIDNQIPLFNFPLEYEILKQGETYIDPNVSESIYTYKYSSIPHGIAFPNVPFEIIEELYLDMSDPLLIAESFWQTNNELDINEYVFKGGLTLARVQEYDNNAIQSLKIEEIPDYPCPSGYHWAWLLDDSEPSANGRPVYTWQCRKNFPTTTTIKCL